MKDIHAEPHKKDFIKMNKKKKRKLEEKRSPGRAGAAFTQITETDAEYTKTQVTSNQKTGTAGLNSPTGSASKFNSNSLNQKEQVA